MLTDSFNRKITYLRISITDRCDLRCVYCMPAKGLPLKDHHDVLRYEEIAQIVRIAAEHGVREVRITGGEPLVRPDLPSLIRMIAEIPGIEDLSLTTNGMLLERQAAALAEAGLNRVNVSLDTLNPEKFKRITRLGKLEKLWRGIEAAESSGLTPIKINTVAMRNVNDDEFLDIARLSLMHPWSIRFIELMPVNNQAPWGDDFPLPEEMYISVQEIKSILQPLNLVPFMSEVGNGPARVFHQPGAPGTIGFISPLGEHFCQQCNRLRLTADGCLRPCLLSDKEIPVLHPLRAGQPIYPLLKKAVDIKPLEHQLEKAQYPKQRFMTQIGG
jgi:GTP 3',8-cyclase